MLRKTSFVILIGAAASPASATLLLYEPFNYGPAGTEISTADGAGGWLKVPATTTLEPRMADGSLEYTPGLPWTPSGNMLSMTGSSGGGGTQASSTRSIPGQPFYSADESTLYYSMLFRVNTVTGLSSATAGSFVAGFRNNGTTNGLASFEAGAPLTIRQTGAGTGRYYLGTGLTQQDPDRVYDTATSYGANETLLLVLAYQFVTAGEDFARLWVNPDPTKSQLDNAAALKVTASATDGHGIALGRITNFFLRNNGAAPGSFNVDELRIASSWDGVMSTTPQGVWLGGTGNWSDGTKWSGGAAPGAAVPAYLDANNTGAASVVTLDQDATARAIGIDAGDTLNIPAGRSLTLGAAMVVGGTVNSSGAVEVLNPSGTTTNNGLTIAGGELRFDAGTIKPNGTVALSSGGQLLMAAGRDKVLKATTLSISSTSRLDLSDNFLIVANGSAGTFNGTSYTGVQGDVARAYNFGAWDQPGLTTSQENAGQNAGPLSGTTTIGVATAEQVLFIAPTETAIWAGETVTGTSVLAMYTYAGDVNFDGLIDGADYGTLDNWIQFPGTSGYANGDVNYDGVIDGADYGVLDNSIQLQGAPFPTDLPSAAAVVAVPEPAGVISMMTAAAMGALLSRRRRRRVGSQSE